MKNLNQRGWTTIVLLVAAFALGEAAVAENKYISGWPGFQKNLKPGSSTSATKAILPDDVRVVEPGEDIPAEFRQFLGIWHGWLGRDAVFDLKLAIEKIVRDGDDILATIVYAGASTEWNTEPFHVRIDGKFVNGELRAMMPSGRAEVIYRLRSRDTIDAKWIRPAGTSWATGVAERQ